MDFNTFSDAFSHNRRSKEHLINLILNKVDDTPEFSLLLGAGASVSSGVKSAAEMIADWQKTLYGAHRGNETFTEWLEKQEWYNSDDQYSRLFELVYDQPSQRRAYVEQAIKSSKPGWGYSYLASLLEKKLFNVIFTTNFDDLINESCYRFTNALRPMVCAHDSAVSSVRIMSDRPKVIKLHGDFLYDSIKNTSSELQSLEANMRDKFIEFANEYGLIVIGYAGIDQSIMDLLDVIVRSESYFRNGIYWCLRPSSIPSRRLRQLLRNDRVYWVEIEGFDEFMADIAEANNIKLPVGVIAPHITAIERTKHLLLESNKNFKSPILETEWNNLNEVYNRIQSALSSIGLLDSISDDNSEFLLHLKNKGIPLLECHTLIGKEKFKEAIPVLTELIKDNDLFTSKRAWKLLIRCLLRDTSTLVDVEKLLAMATPEKWNDSVHFMDRGYFLLYINKPDESLSFSNRALEINPGLVPAKVNKALAMLMSEKMKELNNILTELKGENQAEHHRAAAFAMDGDFNKCIVLLQKSFALGRYTPDDACRDVVFRAYWDIPKFRESLAPFTVDDNIKLPFLNSCPMSDAEKKLNEKIKKEIYK